MTQKQHEELKARIVGCYVGVSAAVTGLVTLWWGALAVREIVTGEGAPAVGLVALGIVLNAALTVWLTDYVLGWGWHDDDEDDWRDPEPVTLPPLKDLMPGGGIGGGR